MRLEGQAKMGYYPTPLSQVALIVPWLEVEPGKPVRLLDPCAGKGEALEALARALEERGAQVETWGVELSPARAEEAAARLDRVLPTAWEQAHVRDGTVSLCFLNPPYDYEGLGDGRRQEFTFLKSSTATLMPGGVLVYVIPEHVLRRDRAILRHLTGWYRDVRVFRFTPDEYQAYSQIVLVGVKRREYHHSKDAQIAALAGIPAPVLAPPEAPAYAVPKAPPASPKAFYFTPTTGEDYARAIAWEGIPVADLVQGDDRDRDFEPVMPLKRGHLAMLLSAGLAGQMWLTGEDGMPLLVRGRVIKDVRYTPKVGEDDESDEVVVIQQDVLRTVIAVASPSGVRKINAVEELRTFIKAHARQMADVVLQHHRPLYNFDATPTEWHAMDHLSRHRYLPGRAETGLMKAQKHVTVALTRLVLKHGVGILNAEMGWGKTTVAAALPEVLGALGEDAYPVLVACPAHLVENWAREIRDIVPLAQVRLITPAVHKSREEARRARKSQAKGSLDCSLLQFIQDYRRGLLGKQAFAVISYETLKLGPGFDPVAVPRRVDGEMRLCCPDCGQPVVVPDEEDNAEADQYERSRRQRATRPATWDDLEAEPRFCQARVLHRRWDPERERLTWKEEVCGAPLHTWTHFRRQAGADLLRRYPGFFGLFVADEVHKAKGGSTDVGAAFGKAVRCCRYSVALTGTLFGGKSKSLFYILHRMVPEVRAAYGYDEEDRWSEDFGVRKQALVMKRADVERGFFSGYRRKKGKVSEQPGISPAVLRYLLPYTVFSTLADLGYELPPYREEAVVLDMDTEQRAQYDAIDNELRSMVREKPRLLATWLQTTLGRPDTAFREEEIVARITVGRSGRRKEIEELHLGILPPVVCPGLWRVEGGDGKVAPAPGRDDTDLPRLLAKERWLADFCRAEVAAGRRVLVYVRLTGTRDIQGRLVKVLREAGLRVAVLRQDVSPRRRDRWVRRHLPDVLITNPRLVETGLNLVDYATVAFYEIDYSLYTTWQACARVWRPGQVLPVRVVFVAYRDSMEEKAVGLVGEKIAAAQLLYGDEVGGAIVPEPEDDFLDELAKAALEGRKVNLEAIFARENEGTISPLGSPTARSPALPAITRRPSLAKVEPIDPAAYRQGALFQEGAVA